MKMNKCFFGGNLTRDPDLKYSPGGMAICSVSIALNEKYKTKDGEQVEKVHYVDCTAFGKRAENLNEYFSKGKPIFVECSVDFQQWETAEGDKRSAVKFKIWDWQFTGGREDQAAKSATASEPTFPKDKPDIAEEEIPF